MQNNRINIVTKYGTSLNTREGAIDLFNVIKSIHVPEIELDFAGVEFMSRSFADQFFKERLKLHKHNISLVLENMNKEIEHILTSVSKTQNKKGRSFNAIEVINFKNMNEMSDFLLSTKY